MHFLPPKPGAGLALDPAPRSTPAALPSKPVGSSLPTRLVESGQSTSASPPNSRSNGALTVNGTKLENESQDTAGTLTNASSSIPSSSRDSLCSECGLQPSKYTCPRCSTRTCSLDCSRSHKTTKACSGQRDKAKYVSMNQYTYGALMDDYVWLEQGRRKVHEWGKDIGGTNQGSGETSKTNGKRKLAVAKSEGLKRELERRGIHMITLPDGMHRKRQNQSSWNPKTQTLHLTIEFRFKATQSQSEPDKTNDDKSDNPLAATSTSSQQHRVLLDDDLTLAKLYHSKQLSHRPQPFSKMEIPQLVFAMRQISPPSRGRTDPAAPKDMGHSLRYYLPLPADQPIDKALAEKTFVEFPIIEVWRKQDWQEQIARNKISVIGSNGLPEEDESEESSSDETSSSDESSTSDSSDSDDEEAVQVVINSDPPQSGTEDIPTDAHDGEPRLKKPRTADMVSPDPTGLNANPSAIQVLPFDESGE